MYKRVQQALEAWDDRRKYVYESLANLNQKGELGD